MPARTFPKWDDLLRELRHDKSACKDLRKIIKKRSSGAAVVRRLHADTAMKALLPAKFDGDIRSAPESAQKAFCMLGRHRFYTDTNNPVKKGCRRVCKRQRWAWCFVHTLFAIAGVAQQRTKDRMQVMLSFMLQDARLRMGWLYATPNSLFAAADALELLTPIVLHRIRRLVINAFGTDDDALLGPFEPLVVPVHVSICSAAAVCKWATKFATSACPHTTVVLVMLLKAERRILYSSSDSRREDSVVTLVLLASNIDHAAHDDAAIRQLCERDMPVDTVLRIRCALPRDCVQTIRPSVRA